MFIEYFWLFTVHQSVENVRDELLVFDVCNNVHI